MHHLFGASYDLKEEVLVNYKAATDTGFSDKAIKWYNKIKNLPHILTKPEMKKFDSLFIMKADRTQQV